jgi:hypothetical protein
VEKEVSGKMQSRSRIIAAAVMALIAITTIAYAQVIMGSLTINTEEIVTTVPSETLYIPARGAVSKDIGNIVLTFPSNYGGLKYRVRVELAVDDLDVYTGLRALVVRVGDEASPYAILTLNTPYDEFTLTIPSGGSTETLPVHVVVAAGAKEVSSAVIRLRVTIVGVEQ